MKKNNKKGFTLIELLAVIIILGILLLIAVPAVSKYITDSRKKTYKNNLLKMVDEVSNNVNSLSGGYTFSSSEYLIVPLACVELEKGSNTKSPFGTYEPHNSFIVATWNNEPGGTGFKYYVAALDDGGYGVNIADPYSSDFDVISNPELSKIKPKADDTYKIYGELSGEINTLITSKNGKLLTCEGYVPEVYLMSDQILEDNTEETDTGIDFSQTSDVTGTNGLYYTNDENDNISYYFRGNVENNYVKFGKDSDGNDILWRIVRINEDGSYRIITQESVGKSDFNLSANDNAYVGYMYGATGQSGDNGYNLTHSNDNPSTIKTYLDNWYANKTNLPTLQDKYIEDAGFCNDRSISSGLGYGKEVTNYLAFDRMGTDDPDPQFACPNPNNDLFTLDSSKGNGKLRYPVGLITKDEVIYAGGRVQKVSGYLNNGQYSFWTMTPSKFLNVNGGIAMVYVGDKNNTSASRVDNSFEVRPVINLKKTVKLSNELPDGCDKLDGTKDCPYIIKTN